ncbi:ribbon-helix-helix domain-containing protein [Sphingosinithalassobacter sp. CS137]|uniref:ribbon-helix-helix domain-containing protein n=1 Tax=Sphingosinithalassobacter sp. CS137 TaxID=2762748 RepID=UPI00165EA719|nr:ribbon-helix-helix domain-containing protein [Sphingosinithalassobacter sp. CS137]
MSRKPSFANLRDRGTASDPAPQSVAAATNAAPAPTGGTMPVAPSRQGRKQIAGFFSPEMSFAMHMLARREGKSLQALMAEAFNDVLRKYGESPISD